MPRIYTFPSLWGDLVKSARFSPQPFSLSAVGMFSGIRRSSLARQLWVARLTLQPAGPCFWRAWEAFRNRLDGVNGVVRLFDPDRRYPRGTAAGLNDGNKDPTGVGEPWSDATLFSDGYGWRTGSRYIRIGETQAAGVDNILLAGLNVSTANALRAGDLLELADWHLHEVQEDVDSDSSGRARVEIRPRLRAGIAEGDQVNLVEAAGLFCFASDDEAAIERNRPGRGDRIVMGSFGATFVEYIAS